mmetsp:Transcript_13698/g.36412  ORF Transcript_13698/g.36412 Transcript_13698/m.36412 type:complete len:202 (+) Transcript_13698:567-1172(+)
MDLAVGRVVGAAVRACARRAVVLVPGDLVVALVRREDVDRVVAVQVDRVHGHRGRCRGRGVHGRANDVEGRDLVVRGVPRDVTVRWLRGDDVIAADAVHLDREHVGDVVRSAVHSLCRKILRAVVAVEDDLVRDLRAHDDVDAAQTIDVRGDDARRPVRTGNTTCTTCNHVLRERGWIRVVHALEPEDAVTGVGGTYDVHV